MITKNKIIIAVNDFKNINSFTAYGTELAKRLHRPATLISAANVPTLVTTTGMIGVDVGQFNTKRINDVKDMLEIDLNKRCLELKQIWNDIDYEVEIGFKEETFIQKAKEENPFLFLVEGKNDLTSIGEWFGTYETRMAEEINVPTLIVPQQYPWQPINDILYVMRLDDKKARNIRVLHNMAKELDAKLHIMMLSDDDTVENHKEYERIVAALENFYDYKRIQYHFVLEVQTANEIKRMTSTLQINCLAFEHAESSFVEKVFSDLNSERIILQSEIPVLVF